MTYQPSFAKETSTPVAASDVTELGWLASESRVRSREISDDATAAPNGEPPRRRVPDCDIINIGARRTGVVAADVAAVQNVVSALEGSGPATSAGAVRRRNLTGPLLALLILELAGFGGNYLRKRYVESQVIVVPATGTDRSVIT
jgi:hypothetical protein